LGARPPDAPRVLLYAGEMHEVLDGILRTTSPGIEIPLEEIFEAD